MSRSYSCKLIQDKYLKSNGKSNITLQVIISREKAFIKTGIEVQPYLFNSNTNKVIAGGGLTKAAAQDLNLILDNELAKANEVFVRARLKNVDLSAKLFKEIFLKSENINKIDFIEFYRDELTLLKGSRKASTIVTYDRVIKRLSKFRDKIYFNELDISFIEDFDRYLIKQGLNQNTRSLYHKNVNTIINTAINRGIDFINPYKNFKRTRIRGNRDFLTIDQLKVLINIYETNQLPIYQHKVLEYFLFSCYTGLRFSDIETANSSNISDKMYIYTPIKSINKLKKVKVPLSDRAINIVNGKKGLLFDTRCNQKVNVLLKDIAESAEINKHLSFHVARHTFATSFLSLGGKVEVLQKIMGHSKLETTMIYVHILEDDMIEQMAYMDAI